MQIGVVGLGRMGANISRRLMRAGHSSVVWDANQAAVDALGKDGATTRERPGGPRRQADRNAESGLGHAAAGQDHRGHDRHPDGLLAKGDIIIDGGNTYYKDDIRRGKALAAKGIKYVDVGTSRWRLGPPARLLHDDRRRHRRGRPPRSDLCRAGPGIGTIARTPGREGRDPRAEQGYIHAGPIGAGHFVKMIHNGIEYGMMQAFAEGFDILRSKSDARCRRRPSLRPQHGATSPRCGGAAAWSVRGCST